LSNQHNFRTPFNVAVSSDGLGPMLKLAGELDLATAPVLESAIEAMLEDGAVRLCLDCHDLDFIDVRGVDVLAWAVSRLEPRAGRLHLRGASDLLVRMLTATALDRRLVVDPRSRRQLATEDAD
jgi:anti-anti-sigma factor